MTTYRLHNNIFKYHNAYVDFRALRKQCNTLSVEFSQRNESLINKLKEEWIPVDVEFKSDSKKKIVPEITTWNMSCLVMSQRAKDILESLLKNHGEFLLLDKNYYLYNCLESIDGKTIDKDNSSFEFEAQNSIHMPKKLSLLEAELRDKPLFKPGFLHNTFIICQSKFKDLIEKENIQGLLFDENLAQMFPTK